MTKNKIQGDSDAPHQLFHLENDPLEATDLATQHPEQLDTMRTALEAWCREVEKDRSRQP